ARLLIVVLVGSWLGLSWATTYRLLSPSEIFGQAEVVFTARVVDVVAELRDDKALPGVYTSVTFQVEEVLKGFGVGEVLTPDDDAGPGPDEPSDDDPLEENALESPPDDLELDSLGGEAPGDRRLLVAGSPVWRTGETVLIAAYLEPDLASPLVGFR